MGDDFRQPERLDGFQDSGDGLGGGEKRSGNPLGLVGFVLSLTCLLSPIGLLVSLIALGKRPKGFAIAGVAIGLLLTVVLGLAVAGAVFAVSQPVFKWNSEVGEDYSVIQEAIGEGAPPDSLAGVSVSESAKTDPWGNAYVYEADGSGGWSLTTYGPDGVEGGGDDLTLAGDLGPFEVGMAFNEVGEAWSRASSEMESGGDGEGSVGDGVDGAGASDGEVGSGEPGGGGG